MLSWSLALMAGKGFPGGGFLGFPGVRGLGPGALAWGGWPARCPRPLGCCFLLLSSGLSVSSPLPRLSSFRPLVSQVWFLVRRTGVYIFLGLRRL